MNTVYSFANAVIEKVWIAEECNMTREIKLTTFNDFYIVGQRLAGLDGRQWGWTLLFSL